MLTHIRRLLLVLSRHVGLDDPGARLPSEGALSLAGFRQPGRYPSSVTSRVESRPVGGQETCPVPEDPALAEMAVAMRKAGHWAEIVDASWRVVYMTDDLRLGAGGMLEMVPVPLGLRMYGPEW